MKKEIKTRVTAGVLSAVMLCALEVIGPASPGVDKIKDIYRRVIYIKAPEYRTLIRVKDLMEQYIEINSGFAKLRIQFDFNPMNL